MTLEKIVIFFVKILRKDDLILKKFKTPTSKKPINLFYGVLVVVN
jgi:hypothetical protein